MIDIVTLDACNPGPMTGSGNHTYLLVSAEQGPSRSNAEAMLIDAGVGAARHVDAVDEALSGTGARLEHVLVTHAHGDHASGASAIAARHEAARFSKYPWDEEDHRYGVSWASVTDGDRVVFGTESVVVVHTPGHSPDHIALWHAESRTAFTGDLVIPGGSVMIEASRGGSLTDYMASLERILALNPARLLPAHGEPIDDPAGVLIEHLDHRRLRERQVLEALAAGRDTVPAIAESIYDGLSSALMPAAQENVRAHLEKLRSEHRAIEERGRWHL